MGEKGLLGIVLCFASWVRVGLGVSAGEVFLQKVVGEQRVVLCAWLTPLNCCVGPLRSLALVGHMCVYC